MNPHHFMQGLFALTGLIVLLAAAFDWDWFFTAQNTSFIVRKAGRRGARLLYAILGLILIGAAIAFFSLVIPQ
jgi:small neutral amino acid transporter SnatA (MarC family)